MATRIVQSKQNPSVKELRAALQRPSRNGSGLVALEGMHLLAEAVRSKVKLETVFVAEGREHLLDSLHFDKSTEVLVLPRPVLDSAASTESPQPIAALLRPPSWTWQDVLSEKSLLLVLAGIQDPGNLGTILRSAEAFGASGVVSLPGTVSPWNPKAMRASAGSAFRLPFLESEANTCFDHLRQAGIRILATMPHDAQPIQPNHLAGPVALLIGSEGSGLSPELAAQCGGSITIPCPGPVESLNAAVAASILLYEASRQRQTKLAT